MLSTGVRVPYVEQGARGGVPVVCLHGYSDSWRSYELLLPELPSSLHVYAYSQRGHGDADRPEAGYTPRDYAADLAAFLDAVGLEAAVVVGHSGGSYAAQQFAADFAERTLGLVLIGAFHHFGSADVGEVRAVVDELTDPVDPAFVREFQESTVSLPLPDGFLDRIVAESLKLPARVWKTWLADMLPAPPPSDGGRIRTPTLVQWGDQDELATRESQEALLAAIPGAHLSTYEGAGHCPHWELPARAAAEIAAFVERAA